MADHLVPPEFLAKVDAVLRSLSSIPRATPDYRMPLHKVSATLHGFVEAASPEHAQNLTHQLINSRSPVEVRGITISVEAVTISRRPVTPTNTDAD